MNPITAQIVNIVFILSHLNSQLNDIVWSVWCDRTDLIKSSEIKMKRWLCQSMDRKGGFNLNLKKSNAMWERENKPP